MSSLSITYFRRSQSSVKKEPIDDTPKASLAYNIFMYRQELRRSVPNQERLSKAKFLLTECLVSANAPKISRFAKELMSNLSRIVFYKYKLKRQMEDSAISLKKRLNEKLQRKKAKLKEHIENSLGRELNKTMKL